MKLRDCLRKHDSCVYCLEFPDGKCYVGKTLDLGGRVTLYVGDIGKDSSGVRTIIDEYGADNVNLRILFSMSGQKKVDKDICLSMMEIKYIRELNTLRPNGYNVSVGGEVLGIPIEYITTDKSVIESYYNSNKIVLEYDLDGNYVKEYDSISRCAYEKGVDSDDIRSAVKSNRPFRGLCYLRIKRYNYIPQSIDVAKPIIREKIKIEHKTIVKEHIVNRTCVRNPVIVYDENGDFVGEYSFLAEASRALGGVHVSIGVYRSGYIAFRRTTDDYPKKIESRDDFYGYALQEEYKPINELSYTPRMKDDGIVKAPNLHRNLKLSFPINQFDLGGTFIAQYKSIRDASIGSGIAYSQIYACVHGKTKRAGGYFWEKADSAEQE